MKNNKAYTVMVHAIFIIMTICFIIPFVIIFSVSVSNEQNITDYGFSLIPKMIDFTAYSMLFKNFAKIGWSMLLTAIVSVVAPAATCFVSALIGYAISRNDYRLKTPITWFVIMTMIFSGGTIPTYIVYTKYLGLGNNPLIYILPGMVSAWGIILFRTFFKEIPVSLIESANIDGANQMQVMWKIILPMSKAIFAIQYFTGMINKWNDFQTSLLYVTDERLFTIQYFMQRVLINAEVIKQSYAQFGLRMDINVPVMTLRYAMCVVSVLPIFLIFPYVQKYFAKGISVGSVKG